MAENGERDSWHRGSRFWSLGKQALYIAASFVYLAGYFHPESINEAIGAFTLIAGLMLGGGTWTNVKERDVEKARVTMNGGS